MKFPGESAATITARLRNALAVRYAEPEWLLWEEVSLDGVGRIDAIALNTYASSGHVVHGFEIKATRADWKRELRTMRKSNGAFTYCHRWYLVTVPGVVDGPELPEGWGMLVLKPTDGVDSLRQTVKPARLEPLNELRRTHWIQMARRTRRAEVDDAARYVELRAEYDRGYKAGKRDQEYAVSHARERDEQREQALAMLEETVGQPISTYAVPRLARAIRWALQHHGELERSVRSSRERAERYLAETAWALEEREGT